MLREQKSSKTFYYGTPDNAVTHDTELCKTAIDLYCILENLANKHTHQTYPISIARLAILLARSVRTTCKHLRTLRDEGIISIISRSTKVGENIWKLPNIYVIHGRHAPRYKNSPYAHPEIEETEPKISGGYEVFGTIDSTRHGILEENLNQTLTREVSLEVLTSNDGCAEMSTSSEDTTLNQHPKPKTLQIGERDGEASNCTTTALEENPCWLKQDMEGAEPQGCTHGEAVSGTPNSKPSPKQDDEEQATPKLSIPKDVPTIMRQSAEYFLLKFGRDKMRDKEVQELIELSKIHTPARVNKAIAEAAERKSRDSRPLKFTSFGYIYTMLKDQNSLEGAGQKQRKRDKKGSKRARKSQSVALDTVGVSEQGTSVDVAEATTEPSMTVEEAEKVIAEFKPAVEKAEQIPAKLAEFHEQLNAKSQEVWNAYEATLPQDEYGCPILPEYESEEEWAAAGAMTTQDYLRVKFPDASDDELELNNPREAKGLKEAFEIDMACASCTCEYHCSLPEGYKAGCSRPVAMLKSIGRTRRIVIGYGGCIKCYKDKTPQPDPEFERRVKVCGLTPDEVRYTFGNYHLEGVGAEAIVAKAHAILATQNKSNLILAGRPGVGKTHLAIAIALEAMKKGEQAIFVSVPDMLDEICRANQEHTAPFGLMMKYKSVPCLVLDDLGKEHMTDARLSYLHQIIDYRYRSKLQTIVTTNAESVEGLTNKFYVEKIEPLVSRLLGNGEWVNILDTDDYRLKRRTKSAPTVCELATVAPSEDTQDELHAQSIHEPNECEPVSEKSPYSDEECTQEALTEAECDDKSTDVQEVTKQAEDAQAIDAGNARVGRCVSVGELLGAKPKPQPAPEPEEDQEAKLAALRERIEHPFNFETGEYVPLPYSDVKDIMMQEEYWELMKWRAGEYYKAKAEYEAAQASAEAEKPPVEKPKAVEKNGQLLIGFTDDEDDVSDGLNTEADAGELNVAAEEDYADAEELDDDADGLYEDTDGLDEATLRLYGGMYSD